MSIVYRVCPGKSRRLLISGGYKVVNGVSKHQIFHKPADPKSGHEAAPEKYFAFPFRLMRIKPNLEAKLLSHAEIAGL